MAFTVRDFHRLLRLLEQRPEWRVELQGLLAPGERCASRGRQDLSVEVQKLRQTTAEPVEAQRATGQRLEEAAAGLTEAHGRTEQSRREAG